MHTPLRVVRALLAAAVLAVAGGYWLPGVGLRDYAMRQALLHQHDLDLAAAAHPTRPADHTLAEVPVFVLSLPNSARSAARLSALVPELMAHGLTNISVLPSIRGRETCRLTSTTNNNNNNPGTSTSSSLPVCARDDRTPALIVCQDTTAGAPPSTARRSPQHPQAPSSPLPDKLHQLHQLHQLRQLPVHLMPPAPTLRIATTRLAVLRSDHLPEIATTASHLLAVRAAYASGAPAALILEDDAWIPHGRWQHGQQRGGLAQLMTTLEQQHPDWRVVQLYIWAGLTFATRPQELRRLWQAGQTLSRRHVLSHYEQWGATAYLISRRGMQRLLEAFHVVVSNPGMSMNMSMNMDLRTPENLLPLADLLLFAVDGGAGVFTANRLIFAHRVLSYGPSGTHTASANEQLDLLRHFVYFGDLGGNLLLELVASIEPFMPTLVFFLVICLALADGVLSMLPPSAAESKLSAEKRKALPHRRPAAALAFDTASCEPPSLPLPTRLGWAQTLLVMTVSWLLSKTVLRVYNALYLVHIGYPGSGFESHAPKLPSTYSQHICLLTATCVLVRRHPSGAPLAHALLPDVTNAVCCTLVVLALQPLAASVLGSARLGTSVAQNVLICSFAVHASLPVASGLLYLYAPRGLQQHAMRLIRIIQTVRARAVIGAAAVAIIYIIKVVRMQSSTPLCLFHLIEAGPAATIPVAPAGAAACTLLASVLVSAVFPRASSLRGRN